MSLFKFERGEVLGARGVISVYHINLACVAYLEEMSVEGVDGGFAWTVMLNSAGNDGDCQFKVTKEAFDRLLRAMRRERTMENGE